MVRGRAPLNGSTGVFADELPLPPLEMRKLVGPTEAEAFDNPDGELLFPQLGPETYRRVLDFGCGCGRLARQLIQQRPRPQHYLGIDLHRGMIEWCRANIEPVAPGFRFMHHDVAHAEFNPGQGKPPVLPLPAEDASFSLVIAHSVFTHLLQDQTEHYLREVRRVLEPEGVLRSTWFLFDKQNFPMMQEFQNTLFINDADPTNAVIYDRTWLRQAATEAGLTMVAIKPPWIRGFDWEILMTPRRAGIQGADFPADEAPLGVMRASHDVSRANAIGIDAGPGDTEGR